MWALITGASSGIGAAFADVFARNGYNLVLVARRKDKLQNEAREIKQKYNKSVFVVAVDLLEKNAPERLRDALKKRNIDIDALVNNAGIGSFGDFIETDFSAQKRIIDLNIEVLVKMTYLFLDNMKKRKCGNIIQIASAAAFVPIPKMSVYTASKSFVLSFSQSLREECEKFGVNITTLCPGPTETEFFVQAGGKNSKFFNKKKASALQVAEFGFRAMQNKRAVAVHGFLNKFLIFSTRFAPRAVILSIIKRIF